MDFVGKKVLIMGLGLYQKGSGVSAAKFFISAGARVVITDLKSKKELLGQMKGVLKFYKCRMQNAECRIYKPVFILGRHREGDFRSADIVMKNPAVRANSPYLEIAKKAGAKIETDISLFFKLCNAPIIGITGTRGKSTTTTLVYEILKNAGWDAYLGGNIQISPLSFVNKVETQNFASLQKFIVVLELSSWMLESTGENHLSPQYALITNMMPDHLNTYASMNDYISAKENIFRFQKKGGLAVFNRDNEITFRMGERAHACLPDGQAHRFWFSNRYFNSGDGCFIKNGKICFRFKGAEKNICAISDIKLQGAHNLQNVLAAACLTSAIGIAPAIIKRVIKKFRGIPNRLELIRKYRGIKFYNDTTATTPDAVIAALRALNRPGKIILIAGGSDKNLDFKEMAHEIRRQVKNLILFGGKATDKLTLELDKIHYHPEHAAVNNMKSAVSLAVSLARRGDIILLSPGATSFGLFQNEFDRGRQFVKIVRKLR